MLTPEQKTRTTGHLETLRDIKAKMSDERQARVNACASLVRAVIANYGADGKFAVVLVGTEVTLDA